MASGSGWICHVISGLRLSLLFALLGNIAAEKCTTGFSVVAPEVAVPGKTTAVLVTLHGGFSNTTRTSSANISVNVTLRLEGAVTEGAEDTLLVTTSKIVTGHGIIPLKIPPTAAGHFTLHTLVNCTPEQQDCPLRSHSLLRLVGPVRDVIIRPARHSYRPGDSITFWVLAVDHDLRMAKDFLCSVSLKDPAGTKVALWDQVSLDEGVKKFSMYLSDRATPGLWSLQAEVIGPANGGNAAVVELNVTRAGAKSRAELSAGEQHYVELRFGREMRRQYKPGLPFSGKVEAVSTERSVRVRVKIYDNMTAIYSQDIEISRGEGAFTVPAMLADSDTLQLQAELVSVEGKEIESHYVLAREIIHKWNSSSDCYMLIEGLQMPLQPGETAEVSIASTCPCTSSVLATVTTAGRATHWSERRASATPNTVIRFEGPHDDVSSGAAVCKFNFSFPVHAEMAPVSQLLVYYLTDEGEPVSDVSSFQVRLLHSEVSVVLEEKKFWLPRQQIAVKILAEPGSMVCLIGGKPAAEAKFDPYAMERIRRPLPLQSELDFLTAGMSLFQRRCGASGAPGASGEGAAGDSVLFRQRGAGGGPARGLPAESLVGGDRNDRLWMWKCFNYTAAMATEGMSVWAPSDAGHWSVWALSLSPRTGLRFSKPRLLSVFRPLQVDFSRPPALRVGESIEMSIRITNNINICMDVTAMLALSSGAKFASNGMTYVTEKMRLGPTGATSLVVRISVETVGLKNITVEVTGYGAEDCAISHPSFSNESLVGSVLRSASIAVRPEGSLKTDTESAYFCANEHVVITPKEKLVLEWMPAPRNRGGLVFEARGRGALTVALSPRAADHPAMYRVVVGGGDGRRAWIGRGARPNGVRLASADASPPFGETAFQTLWVSWERGAVACGRGPVIGNDTFLSWRTDAAADVRGVGFGSEWGRAAEFRVWNFNDEAGFSQVLELSLPRGVVPGSAQGSLLVAGGLALPHLSLRAGPADSGDPRCGDAPTGLADALAPFAPLLALDLASYLVNGSHQDAILKRIPGQVQKLVSFMRSDSSFGEHRSLSAHGATLQALEALAKTQAFFPVDPELVAAVRRWLQRRQRPDGAFEPLPGDAPLRLAAEAADGLPRGRRNISDAAARLDRIVLLTADTLVTFIEVGLESDVDAEIAEKSRTYLENQLENVTSSRSLAAMVYGLVVSRSSRIEEALDRLKRASTSDEGEFGWPHPMPRRDAADWLYEEDASSQVKAPLPTNLEDYRASLDALMVYASVGDLKSAEPVARYLYYRSHVLDKHADLLLRAVKAFSLFSVLAYDRHRWLTVSLATAGMELTDTLELKASTAPKKLQLPELPTKVFVYATGAGCATIEGSITYSTYTSTPENSLLSIRSAVAEELRRPGQRDGPTGIQGDLPSLSIQTCFRWKSPNRSGALRMELSLFSGYELASTNVTIVDRGGQVIDTERDDSGDFAWFVFVNISSACPVCANFWVNSNYAVSSMRPAHVKIYPTSRPDLAVDTFFHARPGSVLMKGIADDDLITWFGKDKPARADPDADLAAFDRHLSLCRDTVATSTAAPLVEGDTPNTINVIDGKYPDHPIIVPEATVANDTMPTQKRPLPGVIPEGTDEIIVQEEAKIVKKPASKRKAIEPKKAQPARKKGTLKQTYGEFHELVVLPKSLNGTTSAPPANVSEKEGSKSVNTAINAPPLKPYSETTSRILSEESAPQPQPKPKPAAALQDEYLVLNRNDLWGLLKEVVQVELDRNPAKPKLEPHLQNDIN